jgi:hypothetical protein
VLGAEHQYTIMSVYWLAQLLLDQMRYEEALPLYERASAGLQNTLGPDHTNTKECAEQFVWIQQTVEERRAAEAAKATRAEEEALEDVRINTTSASTLSEQRTSSQVSSRPRGKWRARLHQIVKKSG